jgi:DNA mismatch repair ATPase MutL
VLGPIPKKTKTSKSVASTEETTEQDKIAATTDEKVDPQEETKDSEDNAAKPTKVPTDPGDPAAMSDDKSDGANSEEKQTTQRKGNNNIDDELQAEARKKNSSPPHAEIANNTDNQSQSSDSDEPAFFSSLEEVRSYFSGVHSHQDNWFQSNELPAKHRRFYETFRIKVLGLLPSYYLRALRLFFPHLANNVKEKDRSKKSIYHLAHLCVSMHSSMMETMKFMV